MSKGVFNSADAESNIIFFLLWEVFKISQFQLHFPMMRVLESTKMYLVSCILLFIAAETSCVKGKKTFGIQTKKDDRHYQPTLNQTAHDKFQVRSIYCHLFYYFYSSKTIQWVLVKMFLKFIIKHHNFLVGTYLQHPNI